MQQNTTKPHLYFMSYTSTHKLFSEPPYRNDIQHWCSFNPCVCYPFARICQKCFHSTFYNGCNYLFRLGSKLIPVDKSCPRCWRPDIKNGLNVCLLCVFSYSILCTLPTLLNPYMWLQWCGMCVIGSHINANWLFLQQLLCTNNNENSNSPH